MDEEMETEQIVLEEAAGSASEESGDDHDLNVLPWTRCVNGCTVDETSEVILLNCFHVICSERCVAKLKDEAKSDLGDMSCNICGERISSEQLETKLKIQTTFKKKASLEGVTVSCEICVWDRDAETFCEQCSKPLCRLCTDLHPQTRSTANHNLSRNLEMARDYLLQKLLLNESTCQVADHKGNSLVYFCANCDMKICDVCTPSHIEHTIYNIYNDKEELNSKVETSRRFITKCNRAIDEIQKKRQQMLTEEWNNIHTSISHHFACMLTILKKRHLELQKEARLDFMKQLATLNTKLTYSKKFKEYGERFLVIGEDIQKNRDVISSVNFLRFSQKYVDCLCEMDKRLSHELDKFVDKDYHFQLDDSAAFQAQQYLRTYGHVEYKLNKLASATRIKTYPSVARKESPIKTYPSAAKKDHCIDTKKVAVKSTGALTKPKNVDSANVEQTSPDRPNSTHVTNLPRVVKKAGSVSTPTDKHGGKDESEKEKMRTKRMSSEKEKGVHTRRMSSEQNISNVELEKSGVTEVHLDGNVEQRRKGDSDPTKKLRSVEMSPSTPSSSSTISQSPSDQVLGKRERKKKCFPEFVDTDVISLKHMRKQPPPEYTAAAAAASAKSRSRISSTRSGGRKITPATDCHQGSTSDEEVDVEMPAIDSDENVETQEVSDAAPDDSSQRRQSLRQRTGKPGLSPQPAADGTKQRGRPPGAKNKNRMTHNDHSAFEEAPMSSIEEGPSEWSNYPVMGRGHMKISNSDENEDYCCICLDGGDEIICCDFCPKVFHLRCHIPAISEIPPEDEKWQCNYDTTKEMVDTLINACSDKSGSETVGLLEANQKDFMLACKFVMECYKIPQLSTMRWIFPQGYREKFDKTPFHMKYIRERLCLGVPSSFTDVEQLLQAFKQMFLQAFMFYTKKHKHRGHAKDCFDKFLILLEEYFPHHKELFSDVVLE